MDEKDQRIEELLKEVQALLKENQAQKQEIAALKAERAMDVQQMDDHDAAETATQPAVILPVYKRPKDDSSNSECDE